MTKHRLNPQTRTKAPQRVSNPQTRARDNPLGKRQREKRENRERKCSELSNEIGS